MRRVKHGSRCDESAMGSLALPAGARKRGVFTPAWRTLARFFLRASQWLVEDRNVTAWFGLRSSEARNAWKAFVTLAGMMAGHAMLETARDTLFLSRVPAEQLPWAYLMIAGLALLLTKANRWVLKRVRR